MAFTDNLLQSILQKAIAIEGWAILQTGTKQLNWELNFYDILDALRYDGKNGFAQELEKTRDELSAHAYELPNFASSQTAFGLFKKLRRIIEDKADDNKKLFLYADSIEGLIKDKTKLYPLVWKGEFGKYLDIVVSRLQGYDLFGQLLGRIKENDPKAAAQLKKKYDQLKVLAEVEDAREDELKAVESAASKLVSLMRDIAKTRQNVGSENEPQKEAGKGERITKDEANIRARQLLRETPTWDWTCRKLAKQIPCPLAWIPYLPVWRAYHERREELRRKKTIKTVSLSDGLEAVLGQGEKDEVLKQLIAEQDEDRREDVRQAKLYLSHHKKPKRSSR